LTGQLPFQHEELDALLDAAGDDVLIANSRHNLRYLLDGYQHHFFAHMEAIGISRYLPLLVYVKGRPQDAAYIANRNEKNSIRVRQQEGRPLWTPAIHTTASGSIDAMTLAVEHLRKLGLTAPAIGIEAAFLPADAARVLQDAFPHSKITDANRPLELLRAVKSAAELDVMRQASERVVASMQAVIAGHGPGTTKRELTAALQREEAARGLTFEYVLMTVGPSHIRSPTDEVWRAGDVMSIDSGANLDGYIGDVARMGILGEPDAELEDLLGAVNEIQMAARRPIRPGVMGGDIFAAAHQALTARPNLKMDFVAHGMGLISHEAPRLTATGPVAYPASDAELPLKPGMVVSVETTLAHERRGYIKLEDTVAVTETGAEGFGDSGRGWNRGGHAHL
jgi:Xaa-Pro aminopeptidase